MPNNPTYFALLEASPQPGCPICRLAEQAVAQFFDNLFYENVNDYQVRRHLRESLGFCHAHGWRVLEKGPRDALGVAMIYHDILGNALKRLPVTGGGSSGKNPWLTLIGRIPRQLAERIKTAVQAITPQAACPACLQQNQVVDRTIRVLLEQDRDEALSAAFTGGEGLCLPHLRRALELTKDDETLAWLLEASRVRLAELDHELAEFIRKNDHRFQHEGFGREGDAWRRAIAKAMGEQEHG